MQLSFGHNCKDNKTLLTSITVDELYEKIINPTDTNLVGFTKNLRSVLKYSKERYRTMKTGLPFFSCSLFSPSIRTIKNFNSASGLVIDIDQNSPISPDQIAKFKSDQRIVLGYISPSNMGIKLIFSFDNEITDAPLYTEYYKRFSHSFASQYHLSGVIDQKNCDVSRISFICHDPEAWYHPDYIPLDVNTFDIEMSVTKMNEGTETPDDTGISPSAYKQILNLLDTKPKISKQPMPIVAEINDILPEIRNQLDGYNISVKETESIQYGAKLKIIKDKDQGEINIYTGKQGYKVVTSPRRGTHPELNEVAKHIIEGVLLKY